MAHHGLICNQGKGLAETWRSRPVEPSEVVARLSTYASRSLHVAGNQELCNPDISVRVERRRESQHAFPDPSRIAYGLGVTR